MSSQSFQNFVKIGQYLKFHDSGYNDTHPSCARVRFKILPLD